MSNPIDTTTKAPLKAEIVGAGSFCSRFARVPEDFDTEDILAVGDCGRRGDRSALVLLCSVMSRIVKWFPSTIQVLSRV